MLRDRALARPIRRWGFGISAGAIGLATGIAAIGLLRLDGIFQILTDVPAVSLSMILILGAVAVGALFAAIEERRQNRAARVALDNMTNMPKAYAVVSYRSTPDPQMLAEYAKLALPAVAPFGARILARGDATIALEHGLK